MYGPHSQLRSTGLWAGQKLCSASVGSYTAVRMRNIRILKFIGGRPFKWIFGLKIVLFKESRSILQFQIYFTMIYWRKNCEEFQKPDNCDSVLLCISTDMKTIWAWCVVLIGEFLQTQTEETDIQILCYKKRVLKQLYELGCFPIKPTHISKITNWPTLRPLAHKIWFLNPDLS